MLRWPGLPGCLPQRSGRPTGLGMQARLRQAMCWWVADGGPPAFAARVCPRPRDGYGVRCCAGRRREQLA